MDQRLFPYSLAAETLETAPQTRALFLGQAMSSPNNQGPVVDKLMVTLVQSALPALHEHGHLPVAVIFGVVIFCGACGGMGGGNDSSVAPRVRGFDLGEP